MAGWPGRRCSTRKNATCFTASSGPGFRMALHHKDMGIVVAAAREAGVVVPVGALIAQLMASAVAVGEGGKDHSAPLRGVERLCGADPRG